MKQRQRLTAFLAALMLTMTLGSGCGKKPADPASSESGETQMTGSTDISGDSSAGTSTAPETTDPGSSTTDNTSQTGRTEPAAPPEEVIKISKDPVMPKGVQAKKLICLAANNMSKDEKIMMAVLQGYVSQSSSTQIYFADSHYATYLSYLKKDYGVAYAASDDVWETVAQFKGMLNGYILYDGTGNESTNVANTLGGVLGCLIVTPALEGKAKAAGLSMKLDVRGKDTQWLFDNYWDKLNHKLVVEIDPNNGHELRDYASLSKAMVIYGNTPFHDKVLKALDDHARAIGYGDYSKGEQEFVNNYSDNDAYLVADGLSRNLSVFSGFSLDSIQQKNGSGNKKADPNKHYLAFQVSDGDNVQVILNAMYTSSKLWKQPNRANMKVSWGLPPTLIDLAPFSMRYYYENAGANSFVCSASGMGYFYPSRMSLDELKYQATTLNHYMGRTNMRLVQILDHNSYFNGYLWEAYTKQSNCDGVIYNNYGFNTAIDGLVRFSNGKPVVAPRFTLWEAGAKAKIEEDKFIKYLKESAVKDPTTAAGYTMIFVNLWAEGLNSVENIVKALPSNVEVVTPYEMFQLMKDNIKPVEWDARESADGWQMSGNVAWGSGRGLVFRADGGLSDGQPKATASRSLKIPASSEYMIFNLQAADDQSGGSYRVRIKDGNTEIVVADWTRFTQARQGVYINVKKLAGKNVTVSFDYDNGMSGKAEMLSLEKLELIGR